MKNLKVMVLVCAMGIMMAGCGQDVQAPAETESQVVEKEVVEMPEEEKAETAPETENMEVETEADDMDNFEVDSEKVAVYAQKIKEAVAAKDLDALADLCSYPVYVGMEDEGKVIESEDELKALGAEKIFTDKMLDAIANADEKELSPSMAGFTLHNGDSPNIIFGMVKGELAITGINY